MIAEDGENTGILAGFLNMTRCPGPGRRGRAAIDEMLISY
jgi:hypothetical protein